MVYAPSYVSSKSTRPSQPYKLNPIREHVRSTPSSSSEEAITHAPNREEIRRLRANYCTEGSEKSHRDSEWRMERRSSQRRNLAEGGRPAREPSGSIREDRSDNHSGRHRRHTIDDDEGNQRVSVYRYLEEEDDDDKTVSVRRPRYSTPRQEAGLISNQIRTLRAPSISGPLQSLAQPLARRYKDQIQGTRGQLQDTRDSLERRRSYHESATTANAPTVRKVGVSGAMSTTSGRSMVRRSASVQARPPPSISRASSVRSQTSARRTRPYSQAQQAMSSIDGESRRMVVHRKAERTPSLFDSIFSPQKAAEPQEQIQCLTCLSDDVPISRSAKLACGHRMCNSCLRRVFTMSVTDPAHMPPRCCTSEHIPLKHVDKLFDTKFKIKWNKKYQEYTTKNRIYCPARGCGEWIKPANIQIEASDGINRGRKYGRCGRCRTKVCVTCNGKWHVSRECPDDEATARFAEIAKREGWQRCFNCQATVELKEGCNHMTCRCRAEFCMICGAKWKSCDCPWFNHTTVEADRLQHVNTAQAERIAAEFPRPYREEMEIRREQERRDEELARRLQVIDVSEDDDGDAVNNGYRNVYVVENAPDRFPHDHFHPSETRQAYRPAPTPALPSIPTAAIHTPPPPPPPPPSSQRILRQRSRASRPQDDITHARALGRVIPQHLISTYTSDEVPNEPEAVRVEEAPAAVKQKTERKSSAMAGLTKNTTVGRVKEWRRYVEDDDSVPVM